MSTDLRNSRGLSRLAIHSPAVATETELNRLLRLGFKRCMAARQADTGGKINPRILAETAELQPSGLYSWLNGTAPIRLKTLAIWLAALGVAPDEYLRTCVLISHTHQGDSRGGLSDSPGERLPKAATIGQDAQAHERPTTPPSDPATQGALDLAASLAKAYEQLAQRYERLAAQVAAAQPAPPAPLRRRRRRRQPHAATVKKGGT